MKATSERAPAPLKQRTQRIVLLTASPLSLRTFFAAQVRFLRRSGFRVHTISAPGTPLSGPERRLPMHRVPMVREMNPLSDLRALFVLCLLLRRIRPALIHAQFPKSGLLGMIAARITGIRVRIYTINGLLWITRSGWQRRLLMRLERLACSLATDVFVVSDSNRRIAVDVKICPAHKIRVLGYGASHGVDAERFDPDAAATGGKTVRARFGVPPDGLLLTYVGRLTREKGIDELAVAWRDLSAEFENLHLLLCGAWEEKDPVAPSTVAALNASPRVHFASGALAEMPAFYAASDLCVLPSHREGLPNVALESAAMKRAIVAMNIPGCVDAIQDGVTGLLVESGNIGALVSALRRLLSDERLRNEMGENGREFVLQRFQEKVVSGRLAAEYLRLLGATGPSTGL